MYTILFSGQEGPRIGSLLQMKFLSGKPDNSGNAVPCMNTDYSRIFQETPVLKNGKPQLFLVFPGK